MSTTFALDYDGTFTADPELWLAFIKDAHQRGHKVVVVTMRYDVERVSMDPRLLELCEVFFTARQAKKKYMRMHGNGVDPNIWIDDNPDWIFEDSF